MAELTEQNDSENDKQMQPSEVQAVQAKQREQAKPMSKPNSQRKPNKAIPTELCLYCGLSIKTQHLTSNLFNNYYMR